MARIHIDELPPYSPPDQAKKENVLVVAKLMVNAALTAPLTGGVPGHEAEIAYGQKELELIAREMERLAHKEVPKRLKKPFLYEAVMVRESDAIVFLGNKRAHETPMDVGCGLCGGEPDCSFVYERVDHFNGLIDATDRSRETAIKGPLCVIRAHDLGYVIGSALWIAADHFVDTKSCYSVGLAGFQEPICRHTTELSPDQHGQTDRRGSKNYHHYPPDSEPPLSHVRSGPQNRIRQKEKQGGINHGHI
jgi:uncharacterized ferredoxin-like protein